jgi:hypothetical protein
LEGFKKLTSKLTYMVWYKPSTWFKKDKVASHSDYDSATPSIITAGKAKLHCDNPQCDLPILESPVIYAESHEEIYHSCDCAEQASVCKAFKSGEIVFSNVKSISLEDALKLFEDGKLKQALPASK